MDKLLISVLKNNYQRKYSANRHLKKMLNITNYERNTNLNYNDVSPHTRQNGHYQKVYK